MIQRNRQRTWQIKALLLAIKPNATSLDKNRSGGRTDNAADGRAWARREGGNGGGGQDTGRPPPNGQASLFYLSTLIISMMSAATLFPTQISTEHPVVRSPLATS